MNKKIYMQPSMKVIELETTDIICTSGFSARKFDEEVEDYDAADRGGVSRNKWGTQW